MMNQIFQLSDHTEREPDAADGAGDSRRKLKLAIWSITGFWLIYFAVATVRSALYDMPGQTEMLGRRAIVTIVAMALTGLLCLLLDRFSHWRSGKLLALAFVASVPLAFAYAAINYTAFYEFPVEDHMQMEIAKKGDDASYRSPPVAVISAMALEWYFFILAWATTWVALMHSAKARQIERQSAQYARAAQDAELRALRYQVNPHFLFNTLNSLSSLVMRQRTDEAEQMILNLSTFFRASLARDPAANVPLSEEVRMQLLYLDIEKVRFPARLVVRVVVPDELNDALVPGLILQPLVENAIKYGVSRNQRPVTITINARSLGDMLELSVHDDAEKTWANSGESHGIGLANVKARLFVACGEKAECHAGPAPGGGWLVRLIMPLIRG